MEISRLNHSCGPNCEVVWRADSKCQEVVAIRDIEKGEEMTICYLNMENRVNTREERSKILRQYGFSCSCRFCTVEDKVLEIQRFQEITSILQEQERSEDHVKLYLERENILVILESKLIWRITNLERALAVCISGWEKEDNSKELFDEVDRQLKYLINILYGTK